MTRSARTLVPSMSDKVWAAMGEDVFRRWFDPGPDYQAPTVILFALPRDRDAFKQRAAEIGFSLDDWQPLTPPHGLSLERRPR